MSYNKHVVRQKISRQSFPIGLLIITTIIFLLSFGPYLGLHKLTTLCLIPLLFIIALKHDLKTITENKREFLLILLILIISVSTAFYYISYSDFTSGLNRLLGAVLISFVPIALNNRQDYTTYFHLGYLLATISLIVIMYLNGNFGFTNFASKVDYRDRFLLNANAYSYYSFLANFSLFYLYQKYKNWFVQLLLIVIPILFLIISFVTQSRSGLLLIILINVCFWLFINKAQNPTKVQKITRNLGIAVVFIFISIQFVKTYENSRIKNRVDSTTTRVDARELLIIDSIDAFSKHPIFGVGLDQLPYYTRFGQYSHNSYIEIIAEQGIFGGVLLILLFGFPLRQSWLLLVKHPKNNVIKLNFLFFITFYIFNNFYPFYKYAFSMLYFFLVISIQYQVNKSIITSKTGEL
ncbi:O-antigen ligase [Maribacter vaceletii]|uniref:O-antigen ligase n=1 Tax=Maribacter vaceletii TaxID=1206816 RepID=A0A495DSR8_9FLAO|nr:O-antigen ligase family protein [Maribacter vaceletii]RKR07186.1 O-antigen ligase [Maribacter vaceletii]